MRSVGLEGDYLSPASRLQFHPREKVQVPLPRYDKPKPPPGYRGPRAKIPKQIDTMLDWVKWLPARKWDKQTKTWLVTSPGPDIYNVLVSLGFDVSDLDPVMLEGFYTPHVALDTDPWMTRIYPRFANPRHVERQLPTYFETIEKENYYLVRTADLARGAHEIAVPDDVAQAGAAQARSIPFNWNAQDATYFSGLSRAQTDMPTYASYRPLYEPPRELFGFQKSGAKALLGGHTLLADEPGLGKTTQGIVAQMTVGVARLLLVVPPVSLSNWKRELELAGYADPIKVIHPGRKVPEFPKRGALIVSDSLLRSRPTLLADIVAWTPDGGIDDEAHRHRTMTAQSTRAVMTVFNQIQGLRIPTTGTPVISNPKDLISLLSISGHLEPVFGGASQFMRDYFKYSTRLGWQPDLEKLPHLKAMLDQFVWVRRHKGDVLDLPPVMRYPLVVDVDMRPYREAHAEVVAKVNTWIDEEVAKKQERATHPSTMTPFSRGDILDWSSGQVGLVSHLRKSAGICKIPAAIEWLQERIEAGRPQDGGTWDDPIVVWTHHNDVTEAMVEAAKHLDAPVKAIWGGSNPKETEQTVKDFQNGEVAVLVGSITAAGVAITLTRSSQALFVETDWLPALVQQATDRINRIGQTRSMEVVTMVAPKTLDARIQEVQAKTSQTLDAVLGGSNDVSVSEEAIKHATTREIISEIVIGELRRRNLPLAE